MIKRALPLAALMAMSCTCVADDLYSDGYTTCLDQSGGITVAMIDCISDELAAQDARLNAAYKKLGAQLSASRKQQLVAAQRLWVQYRDANCRFYADPDGGTMARVAANECVLRETAERATELDNLGSSPD